jgi:hypothetical protein
VIEDQDHPMDLKPLAAELEHRARRVTSHVLQRVATVRRTEIREGVQRRLARFALPGAMAAALSFLAILATRNNDSAAQKPEVFAVMVMGQTPAAKWVALGQPPEIAELLQAMQRR